MARTCLSPAVPVGLEEWLHLLMEPSAQDQRAWVSGTPRVGVTQSKVTSQTVKETGDSSETLSTSCLCTWSHTPQMLKQDALTVKQLKFTGTKIKRKGLHEPQDPTPPRDPDLSPLEATSLNYMGVMLQFKEKQTQSK